MSGNNPACGEATVKRHDGTDAMIASRGVFVQSHTPTHHHPSSPSTPDHHPKHDHHKPVHHQHPAKPTKPAHHKHTTSKPKHAHHSAGRGSLPVSTMVQAMQWRV